MSGIDAKLSISIGSSNLLGGRKGWGRIQIQHLACDPAIVVADIECLNGIDAASALKEMIPQGFWCVSKRRNHTHPCDNDPPVSLAFGHE